MDASKGFFKNLKKKIGKLSLGKWVVLIYLLLFPLGKLLRVGVVVNFYEINIDLLDLILLLLVPYIYFRYPKKPSISKPISDFLIVALFSLFFSVSFISKDQLMVGVFHFLRLLSYFYLNILVWNLVVSKEIKKVTLYKALIYVSFFTAVLGLVQYILLPDLTGLKYMGWDDHLFRLSGTFLDPAFTGIILVFGINLSFVDMWENKNKSWLVVSFFLIVALALTYNRASFLSVIAGLSFYFVVFKKRILAIISVLAISVLTIFLLPRFSSEGTLLERTQSVYAKFTNYTETIEIFKAHPLFGVGFNNLCVERLRLFGGNPYSHACSGADSSLLFVLVTTGTVGFLVFINMALSILKSVDKNSIGKSFLVCCVALFVHSLFVQSAFYPFVMGYMSIIFALSAEA